MKVLLSAYSCEPGRGSEPGVGWNMAQAIAKHHSVWVLTRPDESKNQIEAELAVNPNPNLKFVYFTLPFWRDSLRLGQAGAMQLHYYLWQIQAYWIARKLHQEIGFDVIHHITFVRYSTPSLLSLLPVPFIWGPVGGGESAPEAFWQDFGPKARLYEVVRLLAHRLGEFDPLVRLTARKSQIVYATTQDTARRLKKVGVKNPIIYAESGLSEAEIAELNQFSLEANPKPLRLISMGRLLHWKGFHLALRAFAQTHLDDLEYWIVGDGPEGEHLKRLSQDLKVADQIKFWGRLPRSETLAKLSECHILVHPSLHDSGGWVCLEAMAAGRPVICLDLGGPATQITHETGVKVIAQNPEQAVEDMAKAVFQLASDHAQRLQMGQAGRALIRDRYLWCSKGRFFSEEYNRIKTLSS